MFSTDMATATLRRVRKAGTRLVIGTDQATKPGTLEIVKPPTANMSV